MDSRTGYFSRSLAGVSDGDERLKISELAARAGVPVATVRHYLREGLLPEGEKTSRNMAYYPPELAERIKLIKQLQEERFMPLKAIGEVLDQTEGDHDRVRGLVETEQRLIELALADERERIGEQELSERSGVPADVIRRLAKLGVVGDSEAGYAPADQRIVESIARFRAAGYEAEVGFTVHDAARFVEPLAELASREIEMLSGKLVNLEDPDRAVEMFEAGIEPLRSLIDAMHSKALARAFERRGPEGPDGADEGMSG